MEWARRRGQRVDLLESFNASPQRDGWSDFVAVFRKAAPTPFARRDRIADQTEAQNIYDYARPAPRDLERFCADTPDMRTMVELRQRAAAVTQELADLRASMAAELESLRAAAAAATQQVRVLEQQHAERASALAHADARVASLQSALELARHDLTITHASTSWKLTAPLRKLRGLIGS
jgi:hypothetical protein